MIQHSVDHFFLPPRKRWKWNSLYGIFVIVLAIHFVVFVVLGKILPHIQSKMSVYTDLKLTKVLQPKKSAPAGDEKKEEKPKPRKPEKEPEKVKTEVKPPVRRDIPVNAPVAPNLPKADYKVSAEAPPIAFPKPAETGGGGHGKAPAGSGGENGDGGGGGKGGSGGTDNEETAGEVVPPIFWESISTNLPGANGEEHKASYFQIDYCEPLQVNHPGADDIIPKEELGRGYVVMEITLEGPEDFPPEGIHPSVVKMVEAKSEKPELKDMMIKYALGAAKRSGWFPARNRGKSVKKTIRLTIKFYGGLP